MLVIVIGNTLQLLIISRWEYSIIYLFHELVLTITLVDIK